MCFCLLFDDLVQARVIQYPWCRLYLELCLYKDFFSFYDTEQYSSILTSKVQMRIMAIWVSKFPRRDTNHTQSSQTISFERHIFGQFFKHFFSNDVKFLTTRHHIQKMQISCELVIYWPKIYLHNIAFLSWKLENPYCHNAQQGQVGISKFPMQNMEEDQLTKNNKNNLPNKVKTPKPFFYHFRQHYYLTVKKLCR